mmetsp:Transcript_13813/g.48060  ORF Transcript_13813/g.48060 Transcript_13813/m.48060 type:complete len:182 (-) Transcript_13813:1272-1817(-)
MGDAPAGPKPCCVCATPGALLRAADVGNYRRIEGADFGLPGGRFAAVGPFFACNHGAETSTWPLEAEAGRGRRFLGVAEGGRGFFFLSRGASATGLKGIASNDDRRSSPTASPASLSVCRRGAALLGRPRFAKRPLVCPAPSVCSAVSSASSGGTAPKLDRGLKLAATLAATTRPYASVSR